MTIQEKKNPTQEELNITKRAIEAFNEDINMI
jgi:hypothetical protein